MQFTLLTSLRSRLLLLLILASIPVFCILVYGTVEARKKAAAEAQGTALRMARLVLLEQRELIAGARQLLPALARLPVVQAPGDGRVCGRVLAELLERYPYYANFGVIGLDGLTRCTGVPLAKPLQLGDRSYFLNAIKTRDFAIGSYQIGRITRKATINFGYPIFDAQDRVHGVVFAALDLAWLSHKLTEIPLPADTIITILDETGTILAYQPDPQEWVGKSILYAPITQLILTRGGEGTAESIDKTGTPRLYAFTPLHSTDESKVYVSVGIPHAVAYGEIDRIFKRNLAFLLLITLMVTAMAWIGSNLMVLRPLDILTRASERLGQGDLGARTGLPSKTGEFGRLAQTFDRMVESLQQRQTELEIQDQELRRINRALHTLSAGNHALVRAVDELSLLQEMCQVAVELGGYRIAWVGYAEHDDRKSVRPVAQAGVEKAVLESLQISWDETEHGHGSTGTAIRTGSPEVVRGLQTDSRYRGWNAIAREHGIHAALSLPLYVDRSVLGALTIYSQDTDAFDAREIDILFEMAEDMAFGINTLRMHTKHKEAEATIHRMAYYDALTGLPNHASFEERLEQGIAAARAQNHSLALALLDLDRLRDINGTLGFEAGNRVMMETGRRIQRVLKPNEFIARMRGDEFAVLLPRADAGYAEQTVLSILKALQEPLAVGDLSLTMMAGTGIVLFPDHGAEAKQLIRLADVAMRLAKASGNHYAFYAPEREVNKKRQLALAGDLHRALENNELILYYQPKISMKSGRICGFEALARWPHPAYGMVPPDEFITLAERTGMIRALNDRILTTALLQSRAWQQAGIGLPIAVNLSARNLQDPQLLEKIQALYATYKIDTGTLELEITESAIMEDPAGAHDILSRLNALGIPIYIDDFGTGYSSLGYLKKLPVSAIKIDKSFVIDMLNDKDSATIVRSTIMLGHDLGLEVVAEGVENEAVWAALARLGCDVAQGYHMGKPIPGEQVYTWLNESPWGLHSVPPEN